MANGNGTPIKDGEGMYVTWPKLILFLGGWIAANISLMWTMINEHEARPHPDALARQEFYQVVEQLRKTDDRQLEKYEKIDEKLDRLLIQGK